MNADSKNDRATTERRALLTDLYQLTMAYGYWKSGRAEREAVLPLFFRNSPFQCGFTLTAGLAPAALGEVRQRAQAQLSRLHTGVKRFVNPHQYPVGLELSLHNLKTE